MATREELEALSGEELHNRATRYARRHGDVKFLWRLMRAMPAAEASIGQMDEMHDDIQSIYGHLNDLRHSAEPAVAEQLKPLYVEYLLEHDG